MQRLIDNPSCFLVRQFLAFHWTSVIRQHVARLFQATNHTQQARVTPQPGLSYQMFYLFASSHREVKPKDSTRQISGIISSHIAALSLLIAVGFLNLQMAWNGFTSASISHPTHWNEGVRAPEAWWLLQLRTSQSAICGFWKMSGTSMANIWSSSCLYPHHAPNLPILSRAWTTVYIDLTANTARAMSPYQCSVNWLLDCPTLWSPSGVDWSPALVTMSRTRWITQVTGGLTSKLRRWNDFRHGSIQCQWVWRSSMKQWKCSSVWRFMTCSQTDVKQGTERKFWGKVLRENRGDIQAYRRSREQFSAIARTRKQLPLWNYGTNQAEDYGWPCLAHLHLRQRLSPRGWTKHCSETRAEIPRSSQ